MAPAPAGSPAVDLSLSAWDAALAEALEGRGVTTAYQPIIDLRRRTVVGYEALARFSHPDVGGGPDVWFAAAAARGLHERLDAVALRSALTRRADLPPNCFLTVNLEPESLLADEVRAELVAAGPLGGLFVEITEHRPMDLAALAPVLDWVRSRGALLAVDDAGAGYAGLQQILELRPSLLKLDRALVEGIDTDEAKVALVEMIGLFASRVDAWVLAEGIETEAEASRLVSLDVPLAQGWYFGRPAPPWAAISPDATAALADPVGASSRSLHRLLVPMPTVRIEALGPGGPPESTTRWVVVVDGLGRPQGLAGPAGEVQPALRVGVDSSPSDVAHRLSTAASDPARPAIVVDRAGRYLGVIPLRRLLGTIAGVDGASPPA